MTMGTWVLTNRSWYNYVPDDVTFKPWTVAGEQAQAMKGLSMTRSEIIRKFLVKLFVKIFMKRRLFKKGGAQNVCYLWQDWKYARRRHAR